jgi:hypothetical protein
MRIIRKKGLDKIKIQHNKKLFWIIIALIILLIVLIILIIKNKNSNDKDYSGECRIDSDCVPGGCCHPNICVSKENAPDCRDFICSMECSGPLDCMAGSCGCVNGKCQIMPNKK